MSISLDGLFGSGWRESGIVGQLAGLPELGAGVSFSVSTGGGASAQLSAADQMKLLRDLNRYRLAGMSDAQWQAEVKAIAAFRGNKTPQQFVADLRKAAANKPNTTKLSVWLKNLQAMAKPKKPVNFASISKAAKTAGQKVAPKPAPAPKPSPAPLLAAVKKAATVVAPAPKPAPAPLLAAVKKAAATVAPSKPTAPAVVKAAVVALPKAPTVGKTVAELQAAAKPKPGLGTAVLRVAEKVVETLPPKPAPAPVALAAPSAPVQALKCACPAAYRQMACTGPAGGASARALLEQMLSEVKLAANQRAATYEHEVLTNERAYRSKVLDYLRAIQTGCGG